MADFNTPSGAGANLGEIEARLAAIKQSVSQLESRLQQDVAAERKGTVPGRRATERAVREDLPPERARQVQADETTATERDTAAQERNTRARRQRVSAMDDQINAARRAGRLESGFEYGLGLPQQQARQPSVAAKQSSVLAQAGVTPQDEAALRKQAQAKGLLADLDGRMVREQQAVNVSLSQDIQKRELASQALRKHGALTTEFISAAARGNVTIKEMGYQVGATIGKFAGWTAAAAATYGALAAITGLGKGALNASSEVQILSNYINHLDTDKAQEQLRQLAQKFNLPVDQVGEAFQGMGKIFHDQDEAFKATEAALYGVKVGELSAADSTKYLTAVVNGFHLQGDQLVGVLDKINQAQNVYGVSIKDTVAGTAQAAGAWKSAGGDLDHLLTLIVTGEKVTGRSGVNIGTALQRSAETIRRSSKNQDALRGFGIDPTQDIERVYADAVKKVQSGQVKGPDINKLATALSTPQLSSRITPILQNSDLYNKVFKSLSGDSAQGSAKRELENRLKAISERAKEVGVNLQAIGVELERLGAFDAGGGLLIGLNLTLKAITDVLAVVNDLPKGLRESVVVAAEFYAVLRLIRRFRPPTLDAQTGEVTNTGFFRQNPETFQRKTLQEAARNQVKFYQDEQERLASRLPTQRLTADTAVQTRNAVAAREAGAIHAGDAAAAQRLIAAENAATSALSRVIATETELTAVEQRLIAAREAETAVSTSSLKRAAQEGRGATQVAREAGIYHQPGTTDRPTPDRPIPVAGGGVRTPGGVVLPGGSATARAAEAEATAATVARQEQEVAAATTRFSGVTGKLEEGAKRVVGSNNLAGGRLQKLAGGLKNMGSSLVGLGKSMGSMLLNDPITAAFTAYIVADALKNHFEAQGRKFDALGSGPTSYTKQQQQLGSYARLTPAQRLAQFNKDQETQRQRRLLGLDSYDSPEDANRQALLSQAVQQDTQRAKGRVVSGLFTSQVRVEASDAVRRYKAGQITLAKAQEEIDKALREVDASQSPLRDRQAARQDILQQRIGLGPGHGRSLLDIYKALDAKGFKQRLDDNATAIEAFGATTDRLREPAIALKAAIENGGKHPQGDDAKNIKAARDALKGALQQVDQQYQDAIALANGNESAETRAFTTAKRRITATHGGKDAARQMQTLLGEQLSQIGKDLDDAITLAGGDQGKIQAAYQHALTRARGTGNGRQTQLFLRQTIEKAYQDEASQIDSLANLGVARSNDPTRDVQIQLRAVGQKIALAIRTFGRGSQQVNDLIAQQYDLYRTAAENQVSLIQSQGAIATARATTPGGKARAGLDSARKTYNAMVKSGRYSAQELNQAYAQVVQAQQDVGNQALVDAKALTDSIFAVRLSRTSDPLKQAALALQQAQADLKYAKTPADRNNALATINNARRAQVQLRQKTKYDDIEFEASIGKLTADAEIQALQHLEKTIKGNKDLKRQIQQRIYQLKQQLNSDASGLDLDVGNIRLPTTYEIRRAVLGGGPARGNVTVHNRPTVNVEVNDPGAADAVYTAIEDTLGTSLTAARRASR